MGHFFGHFQWRKIAKKKGHFLVKKDWKNCWKIFEIFSVTFYCWKNFEIFLVTFHCWKLSKIFQSLFTVEKFCTHVSTSFFLSSKMKSHLTWSWALGSQIWFKNWFSNAPIFFSCGPIFTSTVSKIFSLDRRIHFGTSWHPQTCQRYPKVTKQSSKNWKFYQIHALGWQLTYCPRAFLIPILKTT